MQLSFLLAEINFRGDKSEPNPPEILTLISLCAFSSSQRLLLPLSPCQIGQSVFIALSLISR
jgi:hypothetical protein